MPCDTFFSPLVQNDWHSTFKVPEVASFSGTVQLAIESGTIVSKAWQEIVQTLRTLMLQYTKYPSSEQYTEVCRKLIEKYPKLMDIYNRIKRICKFDMTINQYVA